MLNECKGPKQGRNGRTCHGAGLLYRNRPHYIWYAWKASVWSVQQENAIFNILLKSSNTYLSRISTNYGSKTILQKKNPRANVVQTRDK